MPNSKPKTTTPKLDALRQQFQPKAARSLEDELATLDDRTNLQLRGASQPKQKRGIGKNLSALMAEVKLT